jgi:hypothetical protein
LGALGSRFTLVCEGELDPEGKRTRIALEAPEYGLCLPQLVIGKAGDSRAQAQSGAYRISFKGSLLSRRLLPCPEVPADAKAVHSSLYAPGCYAISIDETATAKFAFFMFRLPSQ